MNGWLTVAPAAGAGERRHARDRLRRGGRRRLGAAPAPVGTPSLLSPAPDARLSPGTVTFDWSDVAGATTYTIEIDDSDTFSAPLTAAATVSASTYAASGLPAGRLWWRMRADGGGWSSVRRFEIRN